MPPRGYRGVPPGSGGLGQRRPDRERLRHARVRGQRAKLEIGDVVVTFRAVPHFVETYALCLSAKKGKGRMVYGADTSPTEALKRVRQGRRPAGDRGHAAPARAHRASAGHLTPGEAGEHAEGARRGAGAADPHLRRAGRHLGPRRGPADVLGPGGHGDRGHAWWRSRELRARPVRRLRAHAARHRRAVRRRRRALGAARPGLRAGRGRALPRRPAAGGGARRPGRRRSRAGWASRSAAAS